MEQATPEQLHAYGRVESQSNAQLVRIVITDDATFACHLLQFIENERPCSRLLLIGHLGGSVEHVLRSHSNQLFLQIVKSTEIFRRISFYPFTAGVASYI